MAGSLPVMNLKTGYPLKAYKNTLQSLSILVQLMMTSAIMDIYLFVLVTTSSISDLQLLSGSSILVQEFTETPGLGYNSIS